MLNKQIGTQLSFLSHRLWQLIMNYNCPPLSVGDAVQDPQWMPKSKGGTKPYMYYGFFLYTYSDKA